MAHALRMMSGLIGDLLGWRGVLALLGTLVIAASIAMLLEASARTDVSDLASAEIIVSGIMRPTLQFHPGTGTSGNTSLRKTTHHNACLHPGESHRRGSRHTSATTQASKDAFAEFAAMSCARFNRESGKALITEEISGRSAGRICVWPGRAALAGPRVPAS